MWKRNIKKKVGRFKWYLEVAIELQRSINAFALSKVWQRRRRRRRTLRSKRDKERKEKTLALIDNSSGKEQVYSISLFFACSLTWTVTLNRLGTQYIISVYFSLINRLTGNVSSYHISMNNYKKKKKIYCWLIDEI